MNAKNMLYAIAAMLWLILNVRFVNVHLLSSSFDKEFHQDKGQETPVRVRLLSLAR
jgi:hypothetical protein